MSKDRDRTRAMTYTSSTAQKLLNDIEKWIEEHPHSDVNAIAKAFAPVKITSIRQYVSYLHQSDRISHDPIVRRGATNFARTWIVGESGIRYKHLEEQTQRVRSSYPPSSIKADPLALPADFFKPSQNK